MATQSDVLVFFCGVRVAEESGAHYVDPSNWARLQLLLSPFKRVRLIAVRAGERSSDWRRLPVGIDVVLSQRDFKPRGSGVRIRAVAGFFARAPWLAVQHLRDVKGAAAVGLVLLLEPVFFAGLFGHVLFRRPLYAVINGSPIDAFRIRSESTTGLRRVVNRLLGRVAAVANRILVRDSQLLLVTGDRLATELGRGHGFSTSCFSECDIVEREDTCFGSEIVWTFAGTICYGKGVDALLRALALVRQKDHRHRLVLIGRVDPDFPLATLLADLGLTLHVRVTGAVPWEEVLALHRSADVFVFPSLHEGMPKAPLEAMSQGLPVVVTATGAEQYVLHEHNGLVVPVKSAESIAHAVCRLVSDGDLRRALIRNAQVTARTYTYERSLAAVREQIAAAFPHLLNTRVSAWSEVDRVSSSGAD